MSSGKRNPAARYLYPNSFSRGITVWQPEHGIPVLRAKLGMARRLALEKINRNAVSTGASLAAREILFIEKTSPYLFAWPTARSNAAELHQGSNICPITEAVFQAQFLAHNHEQP